MIDTLYVDYAGGRFEYWMYSDGQRVPVTEQFYRREAAAGRVNVVHTEEARRKRAGAAFRRRHKIGGGR